MKKMMMVASLTLLAACNGVGQGPGAGPSSVPGLVSGGTVTPAAAAPLPSGPTPGCDDLGGVASAFKARLPNTPINSLKCSAIPGLYELVSGDNVIYTEKTGQFIVVGAIFDLATGQDLTAPVMSQARGGAVVSKLQTGQPLGVAGSPHGQAQELTPERVDMAALSKLPSIRWGKLGAPTKVVMFGDPNCGFCRRASDALHHMGVEVAEYPYNIFPASHDGLVQTLCAPTEKRGQMLEALYAHQPVDGATCGTADGELNAVRAFASAHGWSGTPVLVRADGAVMRGFRDEAALKAFLGIS
ncbi:DsbC family protein [Nitrospirillum amazonense]|uniref:DsbC family protein n=1 Tax=Nitrospirillum amazonense TaxID=28077 RepID=UPI002412C116|nr:DsbC family protein [Nitrospirillum amazonense]MDG3444535.1 DsbC family protein [Nitrospirillum amazonense]